MLSSWAIPGGAGAAAKVAKTVVKSMKRADKLGGKEAWQSLTESTRGIEEWGFGFSKAFNLGRS